MKRQREKTCGGKQQEIKYLEESENGEVIKKGENERLGENLIHLDRLLCKYASNLGVN